VVGVFVVLVLVVFVVVFVVVVVKGSALAEGCWDGARIGNTGQGVWLAKRSQAWHRTNRGIDRSHPLM
jgi:hypothetical protein